MRKIQIVLICAACLFFATSTLRAEDTKNATTNVDVPKRESPPLISLEVESSRPKLVAGEGISIVGTIQNTSQSTVYLQESSLTMTLPVELEGSRSQMYGYAAYFPTEPHDADKAASYAEYHSNKIALVPGDKYTAYWVSSSGESRSSGAYVWQQIRDQLQYLFFYPGDYKILVAAKYWTDPNLPPDGYRTVTKSAAISVGAPLFVILSGAALGGLIAYIILPKRAGRSQSLKPWVDIVFRHGFGVSLAMLFSVIVTIILSRIAETKFIISVTVNDVWGAIVIGFIAQYGGTKLLDRIVSGTRRGRSENEADEKNNDESEGRHDAPKAK